MLEPYVPEYLRQMFEATRKWWYSDERLQQVPTYEEYQEIARINELLDYYRKKDYNFWRNYYQTVLPMGG